MEFKSVNKLLESSIRNNWDREALSNYEGITLKYKDIAQKIAHLHIAFEKCGLVRGDKVALCSRNQANWGVCFLASLSYGAVPVPITSSTIPTPGCCSSTRSCGRVSRRRRCPGSRRWCR